MAAPTASRDRITRIHVKGFRSLADVTLDLDGLTVLIGDNGSGKSSLIEVFEVLRRMTTRGGSVGEMHIAHPNLPRRGASQIEIEVDITNTARTVPSIRYSIAVTARGYVANESLSYVHGKTHKRAFQNRGEVGTFFDPRGRSQGPLALDPKETMLSNFGHLPYAENLPLGQVAIRRAYSALSALEAHVPFESMAAWAARRTGRRSAMRESQLLQPAHQLELLAVNLGNVFHSLKNDHGSGHWKETLDYVRLGLGDDIEDISASADAAGGQHAISVNFKSLGRLPAMVLSDGTLAYLAFVALLRLPSSRTLLAFDEPELHLHPGLLMRVLSMFETVAESCPVVLATHSDRLLDALQDPAKSVVLCDLDDNRATRLIRPNKEMLTRWLTKYRGLGDIRSTGLQDAVIPRPEVGP